MTYSNQLNLTLIGGGPTPTITVRAFQVAGWHAQIPIEDVTVQAGSFTMVSTTIPGFDISLVAFIPGEGGPLFRRGPLSSLPSQGPPDNAGPIDIVATGPITVQPSIPTPFLAPPITLAADPDVIVTGLAATSGPGAVIVTATGTAANATFSYSIPLTIEPYSEAWDWREPEAGTPPIASPPPPEIVVLSGIGAATESEAVRQSLRDWMKDQVVDNVMSELNNAIGTQATVEVGRVAIPAPAPGTEVVPWQGYPLGVVCSTRRVTVQPAGVTVEPAIGAFGNVTDALFPQRVTPTPGKCPLSVLAMLPASGLELGVFREYRDRALRRSVIGRRAIASYYRHAEHGGRVLGDHPLLARLTLATAHRLQTRLRSAAR
jgi:hypothetical protein